MGCSPGYEPFTLIKYSGLPWIYEILEGWKSLLWLHLQPKGCKRGTFIFLFSFTSLLLPLVSWHDVIYADPAVVGCGDGGGDCIINK